jgi:hypothetical protein
MRTDFSMFRERLAEACRIRGMTQGTLCVQIGLSPRRAIMLKPTGPGALDFYRVCQIADVLGVSVDWLTGRSNAMEAMERPEPPSVT